MAPEMSIELPSRVAHDIGRFTGRAWVLPALLDWWDHDHERVLLLTGGPGTGKSMLTAWLAGFGPAPSDPAAASRLVRIRAAVKAAHFCQATSRNVTPRAFAESVASQLSAHVPGFAKAIADSLADRMQINVTQDIGTVAPGGTAVGVSLNLGALGDEMSFDRAFVEPLKKLYAGGYAERMLLLVDALDEAQVDADVTLANLLSRLSDLPDAVRVLATSRDEPRVTKFYQHARKLDLIKDASPDVDDVRAYAEARLGELDHDGFAARLAEQAAGVFLYAAMVLDEVLPTANVDLATHPLPDGLSGLYHQFLVRELGRSDEKWVEVYEPLLGLIAIAQGDGLTSGQLRTIVGRDIRLALRACKQYLAGELPDGPFKPFHKSFADFLVHDKNNVDFHIDARAMHARIAGHYVRSHGSDWSACDDYGLRYAPAHLAAAGLDREAAASVGAGFLSVKIRRFHDYGLIRDDLRIVIAAAERAGDLVCAFGFGLVQDGLRVCAMNVDPRKLAPLYARAGQIDRALDLIELTPVAWIRHVAYRETVSAIASLAPQEAIRVADSADAGQARVECHVIVLKAYLERGDALESHRAYFDRLLASLETCADHAWKSETYWELWVALAQPAPAEAERMFGRSLEHARAVPYPNARAFALRRIARTRSTTDHGTAAQIFGEALTALEQMEPGEWQAETFGDVAGELACLDATTAIARARSAGDAHRRFRALVLAAVMVADTSRPEAEALLAEAEKDFYAIGRGKAEARQWQRKARELAADASRAIASQAPRARAIEQPATNLPVLAPEPLAAADARSLMEQARQLSTGSDLRWKARLHGCLIGSIASAGADRALAVAREISSGRDEAMEAIVVELGRTDWRKAMKLLQSTTLDDRSHAHCVAQLLLAAAGDADALEMRRLVTTLLELSWAGDGPNWHESEGLEQILQRVAREERVLAYSDLLCDTFAEVSARMIRRSRRLAIAFFQWAAHWLSGDGAKLGDALERIGDVDSSLAIALASQARDAYIAKSTLSPRRRAEGIAELAVGVSRHAPDQALNIADSCLRDAPAYRAIGYSAAASALSSTDRARAVQLLQTACDEAQRADIDWIEVDALLRIASHCVAWNKTAASKLVETAVRVARDPANGTITLGESLAEAAEVCFALELTDGALSLLDEASDYMRSEKSDEIDIEAIVRTCVRVTPAVSRRTAGLLIKSLTERGALWTDPPFMGWSDHVARLVLHACEPDAASTAERLVREVERAEEIVREVFIG
jgi:hypothetical protein